MCDTESARGGGATVESDVQSATPQPLVTQLSATTLPVGDDAAPLEYLMNWREILDCLDLSNDDEKRGHVRKLNKNYDGPIILPSRGGQPKVEKTRLLTWWNHLESKWETGGRGLNTQATVEEEYQHGKIATVLPEIGGHIKKKRSDKK